ncbi:MAG TPA: transcription antitermination factor NusB [Candidatus Absconditabacterales bacterium]|nr:transcription antitermination factor NusB [Candidatus Absconditabacterales bacterium]
MLFIINEKMSTIKGRINARRILVSYFYDKLFYQLLEKNTKTLNDTVEIEKNLKIIEEETARNELVQKIKELEKQDPKQYIQEIIDNFFEKYKEKDNQIDYNFLFKIGELFDTYKEITSQEVTKKTNSFVFEEMDLVDQAIFILGFTERKTQDTPKEVILNEMVELGKAYGDSGSPKLINAIMHKIFETAKDTSK